MYVPFMDAEFLRVDSERSSIDEQVETNALKLQACPAPAPIVYRQGPIEWVRTLRASPERERLLREQRELFQKRNSIYQLWAQLRMKQEAK
jgi:hypothetical protein